MSVFSDLLIQIRTGDLPGAANGLVAISQGAITYQQAIKEVKEVAEVFKKTKPRRKQNGQD